MEVVAAQPAVGGSTTDTKDNQLHGDVKLFNRWSFDEVQVLSSQSLACNVFFFPHFMILQFVFFSSINVEIRVV